MTRNDFDIQLKKLQLEHIKELNAWEDDFNKLDFKFQKAYSIASEALDMATKYGDLSFANKKTIELKKLKK